MSSVTADSAFGPSFALNVAANRDCDDDLRFDSAQSGRSPYIGSLLRIIPDCAESSLNHHHGRDRGDVEIKAG